jgi:decaprenyl-phosphate phosphoribosyltransferase
MYPKQWGKKGLVLAALMSFGAFLDAGVASLVLLAALLVCVASSASYLSKDMLDIERDRPHPKKSKACPLAAGVVLACASSARLTCLYVVLAWGGWEL